MASFMSYISYCYKKKKKPTHKVVARLLSRDFEEQVK